MRAAVKRARGDAGFSLLELLLALSLGLVLSAVALQSLLADGQRSQRLGQQFRQRSEQRRLLALIESDALAATAFSADPDPQLSLCSLAGREPVLQLTTTTGVITYSWGASPSSIWRGEVVMRCGPAYGMDGRLSSGAAQNRVVLDQLPPGQADGFSARLESALGAVAVRLMGQELLLEVP